MTSPITLNPAATLTLSSPFEGRDYDYVRAAIEFISQDWRSQPSVEDIARHVGLSDTHLHHLFRHWAGLTPKGFLQALTLDHARRLLRDSANVLDAALEVGLSGSSRLHDLFVAHESMTPGQYKAGGQGIAFTYGFHASPFGEALVLAKAQGLAGLGFVDGDDRAAALADMRRRWPKADYVADQEGTAALSARVFQARQWQADQPLRIVLIGSDFEVRVWNTLLRIPVGHATTYGDVARTLGQPKAARAVGAAVGRNPISFVVPCHRVLGQGAKLTGYHWGLTRKQAILGWEAGLTQSV